MKILSEAPDPHFIGVQLILQKNEKVRDRRELDLEFFSLAEYFSIFLVQYHSEKQYYFRSKTVQTTTNFLK